VFVCLREVYGPAVAFLFGWMYFVGPTGIAAVAVVFAEYLGRLVGLSAVGVRFPAAGAIVIVAAATAAKMMSGVFHGPRNREAASNNGALLAPSGPAPSTPSAMLETATLDYDR
jgi:hypothetical protein